MSDVAPEETASERCEFCGRGPHGGAKHPLPKDHPDFDAFFDASDDELAEMASEAIREFHCPASESAGSVQTGTEPRAPVHSMSVGYEPARSGWIARCNCGASSPPGSREEVDGWAGDHWLDQWARGEAERHRAHGDPPDATRCLLDAVSEADDPAEIRARAGVDRIAPAPAEVVPAVSGEDPDHA